MSLDDVSSALEKIEKSGKLFITPFQDIGGIVTGVAYASGDAFGGKFAVLGIPERGYISSVILLDKDDEGIITELWIFDRDFTATADNAAFAISDADLERLLWVIKITNFVDAANNQVAETNNLELPFIAPDRMFYIQCVTRGVPNIAAGNIPMISIRGRSQE